ncbi:hypothetical protein ACE6ED_26150 [Paenibacillus sp. CN-4]|uniref:hypothetical protein n=1 Tax=Paenibacillus nanchangensis TaxID=3348343 RepID=UPI0039786133
MNRELQIDQPALVSAWKAQMPSFLEDGDSFAVQADETDPHSLRIHINAAGHQAYSFDFRCTYVDSREVAVDLVDVERAGRSADERTDVVQELARDYTRHIHECAQNLQRITNVKEAGR